MVLTAPAVKYTALTTVLPPELTFSKSFQSIKPTNTTRFRFNRIFKRLLINNTHDDHSSRNEIKEHNPLPKSDVHLSQLVEKNNNDEVSTVIKSPNNITVQTRTEQELSKSMPSLMESVERLPFSEPFFSVSSKNEKSPFELSTYHKHCIREEKFTNQKHYHHEISTVQQTQLSPLKSLIPESIKKYHSDAANSRLQNFKEQPHQIKYNNKKSNSNTTLPLSPSIENHIGLQYASRRSSTANSHSTCSSYIQPQQLRRLQITSKLRPIINETKIPSVTVQNKSSPISPVSISIAQRIELLKYAMRNNQMEMHHPKVNKISSIPLTSTPVIYKNNKETQTSDNQLQSSEIYHIHHHHIHSSSFLSVECRTYLSIFGTLSIILFLLMELITIAF